MNVTRAAVKLGAFAASIRSVKRARVQLPPNARVVLPTTMGYGNMILFLPVLAALRQQIPGLRLLVLADQSTDAWQALDLAAPGSEVLSCHSTKMSIAGVARLARRVRRWNPDAIVLNANTAADPFWALLAALSGAELRVGVAGGADYLNPHSRVLNVPVEIYAGDDEITQNLELVKALGVAADGRAAAPFVGTDHREYARTQLSSIPGAAVPLVGLHLTSSPTQPWKRWAPEKFAELAAALRTRWNARLVLLGGPEDRAAVTPFEVFRSDGVVDLVGRTPSMCHAAALIEQLDLLVSGDTGLMHAAAALGTNVIAIYGPTDYTRTLPRHRHVHMVSRHEACSPCFYRRTQQNPARCPHRRCLEALEPQLVLAQVERVIEALDAVS